MQTIRRLYVYVVTFASLEVVLWGVIGLARLFFSGKEIGSDAGRLAGALSLILVGVPVFLLHWWLAQRTAGRDTEERSSFIRALFLYGSVFASLSPAVQNILAVFSRSLVVAFGGRSTMAMLGGQQTLGDNLVAVIFNLVVAVYFYRILGGEWSAPLEGDSHTDMRRAYRYAWMIYSLAMAVFGVQQLVEYTFGLSTSVGVGAQSMLANGLALLVVGVPIWLFSSQRIERSLVMSEESSSTLRLIVLYAISFIAVGTVLGSALFLLYQIFHWLFGEQMTLIVFLTRISTPLSLALPFSAVWAFNGRSLAPLLKPGSSPRSAALRRLYYYVISLAGLVTAFIGLQMLLFYLVDAGLLRGVVAARVLRGNLAASLAALLVGLPLWLYAWRPMLVEAGHGGEEGDHARQSPLRKVYLYLVLFSGVVGVMASAGTMFYKLISSLLGDPPPNLLSEVLRMLALLVLFSLLLAYHGQALRKDSQMSARALARRHAVYPVLVLAPDQGDFASQVVEVLEREVTELPIAVHPYSKGVPDETLSAAKAVILPAELAARPSEALRLWLQGFPGKRLVLPTPAPGWWWIGGSGRMLRALVKQLARDIRQLSEGQELSRPQDSPPWMVAVYVLAALFGLEMVMLLISLLVSLFQG